MKNDDYYNKARVDILTLVPNGENRVLDIGCGYGATLKLLEKEGKAAEIAGVDIIDISNPPYFFSKIDLDTNKIPYKNNYFDVVLCLDVLEHLRDPWKTLTEIVKHVKPGGVVVVSLPNICHYSTLKKIFIKRSFEYSKSGILDKTHLRFFCKKDMHNLIAQAGLKIEKTLCGPLTKKEKVFNALTFMLFEQNLITQYIFKCRKFQ